MGVFNGFEIPDPPLPPDVGELCFSLLLHSQAQHYLPYTGTDTIDSCCHQSITLPGSPIEYLFCLEILVMLQLKALGDQAGLK